MFVSKMSEATPVILCADLQREPLAERSRADDGYVPPNRRFPVPYHDVVGPSIQSILADTSAERLARQKPYSRAAERL